ncbi:MULTISPECIES: Cu(I)-responsive transcriptional regulator [Vibrio]|uniref:HTH-type transcriptional regulator CueR n=1 Tax=Vibrio proteolyticus NBRC 13287 TaxID=1219065 RepID=U2ZZI8_VIBPR|nr:MULTISPECIES: Cu(I)-responsive transcriptional regulator [Vibrio]NAW58314.1 Cu(I)-responsive transcriptional regulator [Vibrio sp. V36_P2S2PM302]NAX22089.1 Cu(I)-responsive transcriptional regulator [Vibrio sp. V39_P1S14PM300]NAX27831.1 Cu(I)-responsive transcriptional regulator [Vibrio sp. V38_P2S17PM301]NAX28690.1 Cu(I)-responsive transcriptional regulator [Vibrio sp. V37_P2S8PM304]GAD66820.1 putative MerR family transcriptional regulator [Vibrio proteolyticus NBRC 13287]
MNIGEVAKLTGLSSKSIRLYEEKGLIAPPLRSESGYREYSKLQIQQLNLISRAKNAGFSLAECKDFVHLAEDPHRQSRDVKSRTEEKLKEIEVKIRELTEIKKQLKNWVSACPGDSGSQCPIIEDLTK